MQSGAEQLQDWMRRRGFNQADAARYLEIPEADISRMSRGLNSPGLNKAILIAKRTGIPVEAWASSDLDEETTAVPRGNGKRKLA